MRDGFGKGKVQGRAILLAGALLVASAPAATALEIYGLSAGGEIRALNGASPVFHHPNGSVRNFSGYVVTFLDNGCTVGLRPSGGGETIIFGTWTYFHEGNIDNAVRPPQQCVPEGMPGRAINE